MAVSKDGPWGSYSGKIGPLIAYKYGDKVVLKHRPRPSNKPRTAKQLARQQRMKLISPFLNFVTLYIRVGFELSAIKNNNLPNQSAKSYNLKHAVKGEYPDQEVDYAMIRLTEGSLVLPSHTEVLSTPDGLLFNWDYDQNDPAVSGYDRVMLMAYFPHENTFSQIIGGACRSEKEELLRIDEAFKGKTAQTYLSFITDDHKQISDSVYTGEVVF